MAYEKNANFLSPVQLQTTYGLADDPGADIGEKEKVKARGRGKIREEK